MTLAAFLTRVLCSVLLGFFIGLERQITGHPVGIRINVLICMGTSFFTLFPMLYGSDQVFRVGSSIISGVGFLCRPKHPLLEELVERILEDTAVIRAGWEVLT